MAVSAALSLSVPAVDVTRQRHRPHQPFSRIAKSFHSSSPSQAIRLSSEHRTGGVVVSYPALGRNKVERAPIDQIDERQFKELVSTCIQADHGRSKSLAKTVAETADASPDTAKTWINGISCPGFYKGLKLAAKTPSLAKEVVRLIAMESELDPEQQQALTAFLRTVTK